MSIMQRPAAHHQHHHQPQQQITIDRFASSVGYEPTDEEEEAMKAAQELAWSLDGFRPPNAVFDVSSKPNLPEGGGIRRTVSQMPPRQQLAAVAADSSPLSPEGNDAGDTSSQQHEIMTEDGTASAGTGGDGHQREGSHRSSVNDGDEEDDSSDKALVELHSVHDDAMSIAAASPRSTTTHQAVAARALEDANRASTKHRDANFVPYNHWTDDALHLHRHREHLEAVMGASSAAPSAQGVGGLVDPSATKSHYAVMRYYDVQGANHMRPLRRSDPQPTAMYHLDEDVMCYMAGHHVTTVGIYDKDHRHVLLKKEDALSITCFTVSHDGKYVAVAERLAEFPRVTIYRGDAFGEVLTLSFQYIAKGAVHRMCMSSNNKFLLAYCGHGTNDAKLVLWQLDDCRVLSTVDLVGSALEGRGVDAMSFNPWMSSMCTVQQGRQITLWSTSDEQGGKFKLAHTLRVHDARTKFRGLNDSMWDEVLALNTEAPSMAKRLKSTLSSAALHASRAALSSANLSVKLPAITNQSSSFGMNGNHNNEVNVTCVIPFDAFSAHCWCDEDLLACITADGCVITMTDAGVVQSITRIYIPIALLNPVVKHCAQTEGASGATAAAAQGISKATSVVGEVNRSASKMTDSQRDRALRSYFDHAAWASRGLLVSGPGGVVILLDRTYDERGFQQVAILPTLSSSPSTSIVALSVSPAEENLIVALSNNTSEVAVLSVFDDALNDFVDDSKEESMNSSLASRSGGRGLKSSQRGRSLLEEAELVIGTETRQLMKKSRADAATQRGKAQQKLRDRSGFQAAASSTDAPLPPPPRASKKHMYDELETPTSYGDEEGGQAVGLLIKSAENIFEVLPHVSHHSETVTGISVAKQLPFLATCSSDKVLRVFNFATRSVVAQRVYDEEVLSCAIHPSGLFVVITLEFFAKVYALFPDQQQFFKVCDLDVRGCHEVAYSNGGGRLAFAVGNKVQIYDAHKFRHQGSLVGHTVMIKSVSWSNNDGRITTSDMIGTICCWNTSTYLRDGLDASQNSLVIQCARFHEGTGLIAAIGSNKHASSSVFEGEFTIVCSNPHNTQGLVLLRPGIVLPKAMSSRKLHAKLIAFATVSQTLFVGTPTGRILMYSWPPLRNARPYDYIDAHACEVLHLLLSPDERFLFSVGSDNTMFTFHLEQIRGGKYVGASAFNHRMYDELVFGLRSTLDAYSRDAAALKMLTAESREQHAIAMQGVEDAEADALVQLRKEREKEGERLKKRLETLKAEKSVVDKQAIQEGHAVESSYNSAAEALENLYAKLQEETAMRYQQLEFEKDEVTIRFEATVAKKLGQNQRELSELETVRSLREHVLLEEVKALEQQEKRSTVTVDAVVCQTVVDYEHELIDVEKQHKQSMKRNDELVLRAMLAASVGDREVDRLKKEIGVLQTQLDGRKHTIRDLQQLLERRSKETVELKQGMQAKQEAINVAERKMQQMKHQLTALENLRFVLTHQYETLEGDVQPKDDKIAELETTVVQVEKDLLVADEDRTALRVKNSQLRSDVLGLEDDRLVIRKDSMDASRRLETLLSNLSLAVSSFRDPLQFGVALHKLVTAQQQGGATSPSTSPKKKKAAAQKKPGTGKPLPSALSSKGKESPKKAVSIATTQPRAGDASPAPSLSRAGSLRQLKGSTSDAPASSGVPPPAPSRSTTAVAFEATIDDREVLNKELAAIKERMTLSTVFATSLPKKQQQIMALGNAQMIEDNTTLIHEAKALRIEKTTLQTQLSNHENALRDVRAALHRLAVKNRLLMLTEGPEVEVGMAPPSQQMFSSSYRSVGAASQDERGELVESPVAMAMTTPMLTDAPDAATPATQPKRTKPSSMGRHALPPIASRVLPPTSGAAAPTPLPRSVSAEPPLKTWGGQPLKRKPSSAERAKLEHRAHLEQLLSQLDGDAAKMRDHKRSIHELRGIAQELLRMEEQRLLQELADTTLSASTPVHARHNNTTTGDATNTTSAALVEEPDWVVRHAADGPSADSARPMTPTKPPS